MEKFNQLFDALQHLTMDIQKDVSLKTCTTLHIGGDAKLMVKPQSLHQIKQILSLCQRYEVPFYVLGKGSNVLAMDQGYDGLLLVLSDGFSDIAKISDTCIKAQSGATLKAVSDFCIEQELGGFEFACGIPGSVGGAVLMNAGAYDGEMRQIVQSVSFLNEHLQVETFTNEQLDFQYRHSYFSDHFGILLEVVFALQPKQRDLIQNRVDELMKRRYDKQPMEAYSAGSTFKRPKDNYASALIRQAGLVGFQIGDAQVSTKHSGFLINRENATSSQFLQLIKTVQDNVLKESGYELECEIKFLK